MIDSRDIISRFEELQDELTSLEEALDEADIILWDKPELPPVVLPFHMSVMLMASTECGQVNDGLPF
jgi:hypothetical protein